MKKEKGSSFFWSKYLSNLIRQKVCVLARRLYVIALDKKVLKEPGFRKYNPQYEEGKNCYYVGESGYSAEKRFEIHKNKIPTRSGFSQHNKYVTKYGLHLSKKQYQNVPEFKTSDEGKAAEKNKARQLRKKGHAVYCDKQILKELLEEKR